MILLCVVQSICIDYDADLVDDNSYKVQQPLIMHSLMFSQFSFIFFWGEKSNNVIQKISKTLQKEKL